MATVEQQMADRADEDGNVSDADMMALLTGDQSDGETAKAEPGEPDAGGKDNPDPDKPAPDAKAAQKDKEQPEATDPVSKTEGDEPQVIVARDGVHTIDYQKLVDAREEARAAKEALAARDAELAELRAKAVTPAPTEGEGEAADKQPLFGDYTDESLTKGVNALIEKRVADLIATFDQKLAPVEADRKAQAQRDHVTAIYTAHPDAESIVASTEFETWKAAQPSFARAAIEQVQDKGNAQQMVDVLNAYRTAHPKTTPAMALTAAVGKAGDRAKEIIAAIKPKELHSLSDIPAGNAANVDEFSAIAEMDEVDLMNSWREKTPADLEKLMNRIV